jgi:hypothetical protein
MALNRPEESGGYWFGIGESLSRNAPQYIASYGDIMFYINNNDEIGKTAPRKGVLGRSAARPF